MRKQQLLSNGLQSNKAIIDDLEKRKMCFFRPLNSQYVIRYLTYELLVWAHQICSKPMRNQKTHLKPFQLVQNKHVQCILFDLGNAKRSTVATHIIRYRWQIKNRLDVKMGLCQEVFWRNFVKFILRDNDLSCYHICIWYNSTYRCTINLIVNTFITLRSSPQLQLPHQFH